MATVKEIYEYINSFAPFETAEEWDNSGLLVGGENKTVNKILFALDCTTDIVNQAVSVGADLIITHHPVIFKPLTAVNNDSVVYKLIKNNISIICAHTNYDKSAGGVNDCLCDALGVQYYKVVNTFLNVCELSSEMSANGFAKLIKTKLGGAVRYNNISKDIKKFAVCSGSGSDFLNLAKELNCEALLTGDGSHHDFLDADEMDISLVCAGHFETENLAIMPLKEKIENQFEVETVLGVQNTPIITL